MSTTFGDEDNTKSLKVLIAGGGIAGLATAIFLRAEGHHVQVIFLAL